MNNLGIEKVSAIVISILVVGVLAYKAVFEGDAQSTTALIALASPAAAVAVIRRQESTEPAPLTTSAPTRSETVPVAAAAAAMVAAPTLPVSTA